MELKKLTKADIDKVRNMEGFPIGKDEDIVALSQPPYFTACPNPFINEFINKYGKRYDEDTDAYHREPFAADVSEGKNEPIYNAHSYHTKVPYRAIMRYILHYTNPGDIVFDGFCGTGMTGVAAQMCEQPPVDFKYLIEKDMGNIKWGLRKAVLTDLSPAASFIAHNYNTPIDVSNFETEANEILAKCEEELGWMYETTHIISKKAEVCAKGRINYTIWSDVFICPNCGNELVFYDVAVDNITGDINTSFECPHCKSKLSKRDCKHAVVNIHDKLLNKNITMIKQMPVRISYTYNGQRYEKKPDENDVRLLEKIDNMNNKYWIPTDRMPEGKESRRNDKYGITNVNHFFSIRALQALAAFREKCKNKNLYWLITAVIEGSSKLNRERPNGLPSKLSGTLYISSLNREIDVFSFIKRKIHKYVSINYHKTGSIISTHSTINNLLDDDCIDYIFTDPPFGGNLNYSELNFLWESWLRIKTNSKTEAIINPVQNKGILEYQKLMELCFKEFFRVLKPNRWMTVEFHNSKNAVWNAINEALQKVGFIIADVRTLDKKQGSFKQVTTSSAVKQDLIISAYKPKYKFKNDFIKRAGTSETAWEFVFQYLDNLPIVVIKKGQIEIIAERQAFLLFDRMVAYHIVNGISVPLNASEFYKGLDERFIKRDDMYFLSDQVNEYDTARIKNDIVPIEYNLFISNEKSAIAWLYQQLSRPQTYAELQPKFMQEVRSIDRYEEIPELAVLLEENFIQNDQEEWYVPDVKKKGDIEKLRNKKLIKEFEGYLDTKGKLKLFRIEAIRAGFAKLWADKNYKLIVETAERLPEQVIQEDDKLLMYYDLSLGRI